MGCHSSEKERAIEDAMPGEKGGAIKLVCQECGKV
jgi:hypothetical protein